jgi:predicted O-linked N-acetylglucosamine transferase (SPINDLY family)
MNVWPLLRGHDPREFEIFCYAEVSHPDALTNRFRASAAQWCDTIGLTDEQCAARIREDRIDVLVDLALHTTGNRLLVFARKPAPVQVTFAGYPGSTG